MRKPQVCLLIVASLLMSLATVAQETIMRAPKVLNIGREEVKAGKGAAHAKYEAAWAQAMIKAKYPTAYLGMTAITGTNEAWWLTGFESFDAWEKDAKLSQGATALGAISEKFATGDAEYISGGRTMIAVLREELSYHPDIKLGEMRYFRVRSTRVRPGQDGAYAELRKLVNDARSRGNDTTTHQAVYQVIAGAPNGTYLVFTPMKSAAEADAPPNQAVGDAMGDSGRAKLNDLAGKAIIGSEDTLFAFSPGMSSPSPAMVAADPGFWKPKPAVVKTAAPAPKAGSAQKPAGD